MRQETRQLRARIAQLVERGWTDRRIAEVVGCSAANVGSHRRDLGFDHQYDQRTDDDAKIASMESRHPGINEAVGRYPDRLVAAAFDISATRVAQHRRLLGKPAQTGRWDYEGDRAAVARRYPAAIGLLGVVEDEEVAARADLSVPEVRDLRARLGIGPCTGRGEAGPSPEAIEAIFDALERLEPARSSDLAAASGISQSNVHNVIRWAKANDLVVQVGRGAATRWRMR